MINQANGITSDLMAIVTHLINWTEWDKLQDDVNSVYAHARDWGKTK